MALFDNLTPKEKRPNRTGFTKTFITLLSTFMSFIFVWIVSTNALFYHLYQIIARIETRKHKDNSTPTFKPRQPYKDIKKMKISNDLRYYALQLDLDLEEYKITTKDGFVLTLHHLVDPKETRTQRNAKEPILMQHGLLSCSGAYLTAGFNSLAYYMHEQGYDVWLGNNRSWFEINHATLDSKNLKKNETYWDWNVRELAYYDLTCIIDNVLSHKPNHSQLILTGHSQGCTQSFLLLKNGNLGEYQKKIKLMICLAPAIFPGSLFHHRLFLKFMHFLGPTSFIAWFGTCDFLPILTWARRNLYSTSIFGSMSYIMFKYLFGWNGSKWGNDHRLWHIHFVFNVSYISTKLMTWWVGEWVGEGFSKQLLPKKAYMNGEHTAFTPVNTAEHAVKAEQASINAQHDIEEELEVPVDDLINDSQTFFPYKEHWFGIDDRMTTVPMVIFTGKLDFLVDGDRLVSHMRNYEGKAYKEGKNLKIVELDDHSHLDVVWAEDVIGRIGYVMIDVINDLNGGQPVEHLTEKVTANGHADLGRISPSELSNAEQSPVAVATAAAAAEEEPISEKPATSKPQRKIRVQPPQKHDISEKSQPSEAPSALEVSA